ncbi:hypothetical protein ABH940_005584 [Streptacidiphilus sp. BW17]|uniref:hypothetical protein n=1 Tax=Streptacidiphilus sp. BW17 TaxID=3156274 RepID=UPI003514A2F0
MPVTPRTGVQSRTVATFGWNFDDGEWVQVPRDRLLVGKVLGETGFHYTSSTGAWRLHPSRHERDQVAAAAQAVNLFIAAGLMVRNWHAPQQRSADVGRHYAWLNSQEPFPDAESTAEAASAEAATRTLRTGTPELTRLLASGDLRVEARRTLGDEEWLLASERTRPRHYLELRHEIPTASVWITGDIHESFAGQARQDFRLFILRETRPPTAARTRAATAASRLAHSAPQRPAQPLPPAQRTHRPDSGPHR